MKKNIVLCGFMGSGKSTVGKILSKKLGCPYIDMDKYMEDVCQMTIPQIFEKYGEDGFREFEHEAAQSLGKLNGAVIATGGGALTFERNIAPLSQNSFIVYLNIDFDVCYDRIKASDRPLVKSNSRDKLKELYMARDKAYRRAAAFITANTDSSQKAADDILDNLKDKL